MRFSATLLISFVLILLAFGAQAFPEGGGSFIGIFAEPGALTCAGELNDPFDEATLYVVASLNTDVIADLEGVVFKIGNLPGAVGGLFSDNWSGADIITGDMDSEITLEWLNAIPGPLVLLGTIFFQPYVEGWLSEDHLLSVLPGDLLGDLVIRAGGGALFSVNGGGFTFNCNGNCECSPSTATAESSWGQIKNLY